MVDVKQYKRRIAEPTPSLTDKVRRFKDIYGAPPETMADIFYEGLQEQFLVRTPETVLFSGGKKIGTVRDEAGKKKEVWTVPEGNIRKPTEEVLRQESVKMAEEMEEFIEKEIAPSVREFTMDPEIRRMVEQAREGEIQRLPGELEEYLDTLDKRLDRKRTETGRRRDIDRVKSMIMEYERELGRKI